MQPLVLQNLDELRRYTGKEIATTDWVRITQDRIQQFAEATGDSYWIFLDRERAARESPFGTTIAHGFLTLSLLSQFMLHSIKVPGVRLVLNYGLNRVRFPSAVPEGSKLRARITLQSIKELADASEVSWSVAVEREGGEKPCCVAEWLIRYYP